MNYSGEELTMLNKLIIKNFKRFTNVEIDLGNPVVFIGPNNSGKTTALQALALWGTGLKRWNEKRKGKSSPQKRPGVTINRLDLVSLPVPNAKLLWRELHVRDVKTIKEKQHTKNIRIDIIVEGITGGREWKCGLEFDYANEEVIFCRPLRLSDKKNPDRMPSPDEAENVQISLLPPMSGLSSNETRLDPGAINVRVGEGRTAEVLRNLCYNIYQGNMIKWNKVVQHIKSLFGITLEAPLYIGERGEIAMSFQENNTSLDISSTGRGFQLTLLLLAYMYANPDSVLLLDEPDAHLEILRQRQVYNLLVEVANENNNQIIAASHSEVLLNEAAERDVVVAFIGKPHRIDDRGSQVLKSLKEIGFEDYYLAEQTGWILYLEGSTDLEILTSFAKILKHNRAIKALDLPFVKYVGDQPNNVRTHFFGLQEAYPDLTGISIFDKLDRNLPEELMNCNSLQCDMWTRREIENYLCYPEALEAYATHITKEESIGPLFDSHDRQHRVKIMKESIKEITNALETLGKGSPWSHDIKVSDDFLMPLFEKYYKKLKLPNLMGKKNFYVLVQYVPIEKIDAEIIEKLNAIADIYEEACSKLEQLNRDLI